MSNLSKLMKSFVDYDAIVSKVIARSISNIIIEYSISVFNWYVMYLIFMIFIAFINHFIHINENIIYVLVVASQYSQLVFAYKLYRIMCQTTEACSFINEMSILAKRIPNEQCSADDIKSMSNMVSTKIKDIVYCYITISLINVFMLDWYVHVIVYSVVVYKAQRVIHVLNRWIDKRLIITKSKNAIITAIFVPIVVDHIVDFII